MIKILLGLIFITSLALTDDIKTLKIHCGTTMIKPIKEMAKIFEQRFNCKVTIKKGGSQDLYDSLKFLKNIDLYLPGSPSYLKKNQKDNFFIDSKYIGYNKAAIFVQKGNPKNITSLDNLLDKTIKTTLCDPDSGSIGKNSKKVILKYKGGDFYTKVYDATTFLATDSSSINKTLKEDNIDMAINWRATAFFSDNKKYIDIVEIDKKHAPKKKLMLTLLSFSQNPILAQSFIDFAISDEGQTIMKKYGFL